MKSTSHDRLLKSMRQQNGKFQGLFPSGLFRA